jgi:GT2 family glycosyltransferase
MYQSFYVTSFGPTPSRVAIIDGVFMAINLEKIASAGVRFDEQFKFHHYDIDFSLQCNKNSLKIGVWPILINHQSPGLKGFDDSWNSSNEKFINKWKNK